MSTKHVWATKLALLRAERDKQKSTLLGMQKPEVRNQNLAAHIKRLEKDLEKNRERHKEKWIEVDVAKDQVA